MKVTFIPAMDSIKIGIIGYLLASYAYINSFPVLYIPRATNWVMQGSYSTYARYVLNRLKFLNSGILNKIKPQIEDNLALGKYNSLEALIDFGLNPNTKTSSIWKIEQVIFAEFSLYTSTPIYYIIEEHQELVEAETKEPVHSYFQPWLNGSGRVFGQQIFHLYIRYVRMQPLKQKQLKKPNLKPPKKKPKLQKPKHKSAAKKPLEKKLLKGISPDDYN